MDELRNFNAPKLYEKLNLSDNDFEEFLKDLGLIFRTRTCNCGGDMHYKQQKIQSIQSGVAREKFVVRRKAILLIHGLKAHTFRSKKSSS